MDFDLDGNIPDCGFPDLLALHHTQDTDLQRYLEVYGHLSNFYNTRDMQKRRLDLKNAIRSEWDRAVHQVLRMMGGACHQKKDASSKIFIGIGSSPVKGQAGPFVRYMIHKLKSLGYNDIYSVNEAYTSQKCCHCGNQTTLERNTRYRIRHCPTCNLYHHRDVMAGHNIANVVEGYVMDGKRPNYLCRVIESH